MPPRPDRPDYAFSRRQFMRRAAAMGVALPALPVLLDACSSSSKSNTTGTGSSTTAGAAGRAANQALTIGATQDEYVTSGAKSYLGAYPLNANVYEPLIRLLPDYSLTAALATSWEQMGPNTFRFHLRPGVTFHDGSPLTADDVKYTFDRIASAGGGNVGLKPNSTVVVDPMTVDVTPKKPDLRIFEQVVHPEYSILKNNTQPGPGTGPGTGPFQWVSYAPKSSVVVKRNESYWGTKALASQLTFKFIPDDNSRGLALSSGQLDIARDLPRPTVSSLQSQGLKIVKAPVGLYNALYLNMHGAAPYTACSDIMVRNAIQTGLDRAGLIKSVFGGLAAPAQTLLPPALLGDAASMIQGFSYDPDKSKSTLDAAGWTASGGGIRSKGGKSLSLTLVNGFPDANANTGVPEFVQASLRNIGIDVKIVTEPDGDAYSSALGMGAGDMFLETGNQNDANPAFLPQILFYSRQAFVDYSKLFGPGAAFDDLIDKALADTSETTVKQDTAAAIHQVVDVAQVLVETAGLYRIFGTRSNVAGLVPHPSDVNQTWSTVYRTA